MTRWAVAEAPSARALAAAVRAGEADPLDLVEAALDQLGACDDDVRAFVHVDAEAARREAVARRASRGPLAGVPVAVKDLFDVAGQTTRAGSLVPPPVPATTDATAVARLRAAGAVVLGRTRTHEFAWGLTTQHPVAGGTRNPHDTARVPGGSSGGSAAAVAAGVVPLALGTDTGCSIRLPAAWCGLVGHKPTHGLVPLDGVVPLAPSLDAGGAVVRTVDDAVLALEVLTGRPLAEVDLTGLRVGRVDVPGLDDAVTATGAAAVREVALPAGAARTYGVVQGAEAIAVHRERGWWPEHAEAYGDDVRARAEASAALSADDVAAAGAQREALISAFDALLDDVDLLVVPVASCGPSRVDAPDDRPDGGGPLRSAVLPWTTPANLCGLPACAVPAGVDADGLPVGVQLVGRRGDDARVLAVARRVERHLALGGVAPA